MATEEKWTCITTADLPPYSSYFKCLQNCLGHLHLAKIGNHFYINCHHHGYVEWLDEVIVRTKPDLVSSLLSPGIPPADTSTKVESSQTTCTSSSSKPKTKDATLLTEKEKSMMKEVAVRLLELVVGSYSSEGEGKKEDE